MRVSPPSSRVSHLPPVNTCSIGLFALLLATACATSGQMRPDAVARLERNSAARPSDEGALRALGIAYYKTGRFADARTALSRAAQLNPKDGTAALYLGLAAEQMHDIPAAKAAYQSYIRYGRTSGVRRQLEARLAALNRQELQLAAKAAVQQEQQLSARPANAKTVAVLPLRFQGSDSTLQPLERGLAELMTTDLARSHELTVVERERMQAIVSELALQSSGQSDSSTNVRAGRIIQAGSVVNGQIVQRDQNLRVDAAIVNTTTSQVSGGAEGENTLDRVFDIEKGIVLQLFDSLGVRLTTAERNLIEQRPTRSLQAFLAYSRGLTLEDQGQYEEAARNFRDAARIDPGFTLAQQKGAETASIAQGTTMTTASIEGGLTGTTEETTVQQAASGNSPDQGGAQQGANEINQSQADGATQAAGGSQKGPTAPPPPSKDPGTSGVGGDQPPTAGTVKIVIHIPHP
jgi:tetratricopeptide (TPR) repeat protein